MSKLIASLTYSLTRFRHMAVDILLMNNTQWQIPKRDYVHGMCVRANTYAQILRGVVRKVKRATYISLRSACTQGPLLSAIYVDANHLPPLTCVDALRGYAKKSGSLQARGNMHTQFLFFISLIVLLSGGCKHTAPAVTEESVPPKVFELFIPQEKTFTRCQPPSCEEVDTDERMKGHACDSKPSGCI